MMLDARNEFLNVTDANGTTSGRLEGVVSGEVDVHAVLVALPLLVGEETTEVREPEGNLLVGTQRLGIVGIGDGPVEARRGGIETRGGVREVDACLQNMISKLS